MTTPTIALSLLIAYHSAEGIGNLFLIGPLKYDPSFLLLRGAPATLEVGIEAAFPKILGMYYLSIVAGLIYGLVTNMATNNNNSEAIQTASLIPYIVYHCGTSMQLLFDINVASCINVEKISIQAPTIAHAVLGILSMIALVSYKDTSKTKPTPNTILNGMARTILVLIGLSHALIASGMMANIGPAAWDPTMFLVRGEPATDDLGLETAFPKTLGMAYAGFAVSAFYASIVKFTSASAQTAVVPVMAYHFGALHDHVFGESNIVNAAKMDPTENIVGHGFFGVLGMIVYFLIAMAVSNNAPKRKTKRPSARLKKYQ